MGEQCIAHICKICGSAWKTRDRAKKHVNRRHSDRVSHRRGPGQHVRYLWLDLEKYPYPKKGAPNEKRTARRNRMSMVPPPVLHHIPAAVPPSHLPGEGAERRASGGCRMSGVIGFIGGWLLLAILIAVLMCRAICKAKQREGKGE